MAKGIAEVRPYRRWLDCDEDDIKKELSQWAEETGMAGEERTGRGRLIALNLLQTVRDKDYDVCKKLIAEARRSGDLPNDNLVDRIEKWMDAGIIRTAIDNGSRSSYDASEEAVNRIVDEAKSGKINNLNRKELQVAVLKKGMTIDQSRERTIAAVRKECAKMIRAAESGNAWAYDSLIDEVISGNEMVIIPLIQRARYEYGCRKEEKEPVSFGILATAYQDTLWKELGRQIRGADQGTKMECLTETMCRVWKGLWSYEHKGTFPAWLKLVQSRVISDYFAEEDSHGAKGTDSVVHAESGGKSRQKITTVSLSENMEGTDLELKDIIADSGVNIEDGYAKNQLIRDLMTCIDKLPDLQKQAIRLFYFSDREVVSRVFGQDKKYKKNEWTYADIASVQQTEEKTIRKRIYNAKQKIREMLEEIGYDQQQVAGMLG